MSFWGATKWILALFILLATVSLRASSAPVAIHFWHSMGGALEAPLNHIIDEFNGSQSKVKVVGTFKGNYTDALNAVVAAYRGRKHPHLTQIFEVGTQSMMQSGVIYPVHELFAKFKTPLDSADFLPPVVGYYSTLDNKLLSFPFNSSTPILYFNAELTQSLGITTLPKTWEELFSLSTAIRKQSPYCGLVFGWQSWTLVENFLAINDIPIAIPDNGFTSLDVKMNLVNPHLIHHITSVQKAISSGEFLFEGRRTDGPRRSFLARKCVFYMDSSSSIGTLKKVARFKWGTTELPVLKGRVAKNSIIGGGSLWVLKEHSEPEYSGVVSFLKYVSQPAVQVRWHQHTGYVPITHAAYKESRDQNFYVKEPHQQTAVKQLLRPNMSNASRGIRLGGYTQIRELIEESLEKIWQGAVTPEQGLREAQDRSNVALSRFKTLRARQQK